MSAREMVGRLLVLGARAIRLSQAPVGIRLQGGGVALRLANR